MSKIKVTLTPEPHAFQKQALTFASLKNTECTNLFLCAGRRSGKSLLGKWIVLINILQYKNINILWVSPSDRQCVSAFNSIYEALKELDAITDSTRTNGKYFIKTITNSKVEFVSAGSDNNLRGDGENEIIHIYDEFCFMDEKTIQEVLFPRSLTHGRKKIYLTTPNSANLFSYKLYQKGLDPNNINYKTLHWNYTSNPLIEQKDIDELKQVMTDASFRQEINAEWVSTSSVFPFVDELTNYTLSDTVDLNKNYYGGIDLGIIDYTVISIFSEDGNQIYIDRFHNSTTTEIIQRIAFVYDKFKPKEIFIEENNIGVAIIESLKYEQGIYSIFPFPTTNRSKEQIITNLAVAMQNKSVRLSDYEPLNKELKEFVQKQLESGRWQYFGSGSNDDTVIATALSFACFQKYNRRGSFSYKFI